MPTKRNWLDIVPFDSSLTINGTNIRHLRNYVEKARNAQTEIRRQLSEAEDVLAARIRQQSEREAQRNLLRTFDRQNSQVVNR